MDILARMVDVTLSPESAIALETALLDCAPDRQDRLGTAEQAILAALSVCNGEEKAQDLLSLFEDAFMDLASAQIAETFQVAEDQGCDAASLFLAKNSPWQGTDEPDQPAAAPARPA